MYVCMCACVRACVRACAQKPCRFVLLIFEVAEPFSSLQFPWIRSHNNVTLKLATETRKPIPSNRQWHIFIAPHLMVDRFLLRSSWPRLQQVAVCGRCSGDFHWTVVLPACGIGVWKQPQYSIKCLWKSLYIYMTISYIYIERERV